MQREGGCLDASTCSTSDNLHIPWPAVTLSDPVLCRCVVPSAVLCHLLSFKNPSAGFEAATGFEAAVAPVAPEAFGAPGGDAF
jgi:hypothetical protein